MFHKQSDVLKQILSKLFLENDFKIEVIYNAYFNNLSIKNEVKLQICEIIDHFLDIK